MAPKMQILDIGLATVGRQQVYKRHREWGFKGKRLASLVAGVFDPKG